MLDENDPEFKSTIDFARKMFVKVCDEREQAKAETQAMEDRAITAINRVSACAVEFRTSLWKTGVLPSVPRRSLRN